MKHGVTQALYSYWDSLRGTRTAPNRSEVDPGKIRSLLGDTFILDASDRSEIRYRLAGTRLCSAHCRELKGRQFLRGWDNDDREALDTLFGAVIEDASAAVIGIAGHTEHQQAIQMEMLLLPLSVPGEGRTRILGSCAPLERPYWLGIHPIMRQSVSSLRIVWPDEKPAAVPNDHNINPIIPRFNADRVAVGASSLPIGAEKRVGHLTVYSGGKS